MSNTTMNIDDAIAELAKARKKLNDTQGRVARVNARKAVRAALRKVERYMDVGYPMIRKTSVKRAKLTPKLRANRLTKRGLVRVRLVVGSYSQSSSRFLVVAHRCGVKVHDCPMEKHRLQARPDVSHRFGYVPGWFCTLVECGASDDAIKASRTSMAKRKKALALALLTAPDG